MAPALKVFRTPIGFHDAYVAAPSQKAALEAWGADANLFARGAAEHVTDPALTKEPLAKPGTVIKRPRASAAEHFASLGKAPDRENSPRPRSARGPAKGRKVQPSRPSPPPAPKPRPSRATLDAAEQALAEQEQRAANDLAALREQQERIAADIERLRKEQDREADKLTRAAERERRKYESALGRWRAS